MTLPIAKAPRRNWNQPVLAESPISPLDGRYRSQCQPLAEFASEDALNQARIHVEVEWLIYLTSANILDGVEPLLAADIEYLRQLPENFTPEVKARLAEFEAETRHDVKAVEYLIREHLAAAPSPSVLPKLLELVHVFCTSEDINNLSYGLCIQGLVQDAWLPRARNLIVKLSQMASSLAQVPMLSRTHGQSATPTTLGKEIGVFAHRLTRQYRRLEATEYLGKFNGATGTFSAHQAVVPHADWMRLSQGFVEHLGLTWNPVTTQIESHDWQAELYSDLARFNRIAHNLATDCWMYISLGYFKQDLAAQGSTGSSTMPHKVNPIRFENAEANLEMSCGILDVLAQTLVTSRMQRDLSDSSMQRNVGVAFGYSLLALDNLRKGLSGLAADQERLAADLEEHWEVLSEAIQQAIRVEDAAGRSQVEDPYAALKELTRGRQVTRELIQDFLEQLPIGDAVKQQLLTLTPATYIGVAPVIAMQAAAEFERDSE